MTVDHGLRRALHRADEGRTLTADEAAALMTARGADLEKILSIARRIRDAGAGAGAALGAPVHGVITFSKKVFIPLTRLCRDRCAYCTFATTPDRTPVFLAPEEAIAIARAGAEAGCKEALFTLGDRPESRYPEAREWLAQRGYANTLDYVRAVAIAVIEQTGLLPHLNPGVMTYEEMARLKPVSASMGLMLETSSARLFQEPGEAHYGSPDKDPAKRLRCIEDAGRLSIPFTTGILIGIGETLLERAQSLLDIRRIARAYGHVQEVIVQNFRAKPDTRMAGFEEPDLDDYLATIATARVLLGSVTVVQAPPNLSDEHFPRLLDAGIGDWGGISPVTIDHVNPEKPWPQLDVLAAQTADRGYVLRERLAVYPRYALEVDPWISSRMLAPMRALASGDGLAAPQARPVGMAWQDPDHPVTRQMSAQIVDIVSGDDASSPLERGLRGDAGFVYGDWDSLEVDASRAWSSRALPAASEVRGALSRAEAGGGINEADALLLFQAEGADLETLCSMADAMRAEDCGDAVTYVVNRNINFTNVCYVGCRFCAFAQRRDDTDAYTLSLDQVADRAVEAAALGATEVCIQGGIHPDLPGDHYFKILDVLRERVPQIHIHAFSPMEILNGATRLGISFTEWLTEAKQRGLGTIPGTAAEILDDEVRWTLTKGKLPADVWEEIIRTAHGLGIRSSSTIMYGHVDAPPHWVGHLYRLRGIQADTGGFTEFVPLPFVHFNAPIYLAGKARPGPTGDDNRRMHAIARIVLRPLINNVQVSWVKLGVEGSQTMLQSGANDLGGTLMEETISRMAGASHGIGLTREQMIAAIEGIGRTPAERTTTYRILASS